MNGRSRSSLLLIVIEDRSLSSRQWQSLPIAKFERLAINATSSRKSVCECLSARDVDGVKDYAYRVRQTGL